MSRQELPPVQAWFVNRQIPFGDAPDYIKEQWVDVPLPLRQMRPGEEPDVTIGHSIHSMLDVHIIDDGMSVYVFDAVKALTIFDRSEAADFWDYNFHPNLSLAFDGAEGQVYPTSVLQQIIPGIELFDEMEV